MWGSLLINARARARVAMLIRLSVDVPTAMARGRGYRVTLRMIATFIIYYSADSVRRRK